MDKWVDLIVGKLRTDSPDVAVYRAPFCSGIHKGDRIKLRDPYTGITIQRVVAAVIGTGIDSEIFQFCVDAMNGGDTEMLKVEFVIREQGIKYPDETEDKQNEAV